MELLLFYSNKKGREKMEIMNFIPENLMILIASTYVVGAFLKQSAVKDKWIPIALMIFGVTFAVLLTIINSEYKVLYEAIVNGILQGILCWGAAIGINQTIKQVKKEE